ncbi:hypothetical protein BKA83DRAFT_4050705, partial [Pisolithus microcarpus]
TMAPRSSQSRGSQNGLSPVHLLELRAIWKEDQRVPSVASRRAWAISRNANPTLVNSWFHRRRAAAKRAGEPITLESYELYPRVAPRPRFPSSYGARNFFQRLVR